MLKSTINSTIQSINCKGTLVSLAQPLVMGIVNVNEDSFYNNSRVVAIDQAIAKVAQMLQDGVNIIDIGGQSTAPGSTRVSAQDEWSRVQEILAALVKSFSELIISIDTYHATVAEKAIALGASIVNDISCGTMDSNMWPTVAQLKVPYIGMHMQGTPNTMQQNPTYTNVVQEVLTFFIAQKEKAYQLGVNDFIIDVGFGFGKTIEHNYQLLNNLNAFGMLELGILVGLSRKSMIYKVLNKEASTALNGTTALHMAALVGGANILRVHDVAEAVEVVKLWNKINEAN
jgi:dihydropteroate synthase